MGALAFFALVAVIIFTRARHLDWPRVMHALRALDARTLELAALLSACSYLVYSFVDLFARAYTGMRMRRGLLMAIAFVCYAFNQNLGSLVGSVAFRFRLYSRFGVDAAQVGRIVGLSLVTNWSGYLLLAGVCFTGRFAPLPRGWGLGTLALQALGVVMLAAIVTYVGLCAFSRRRDWTVRGRQMRLPSLRTAAAQIGLSACNWLLMAATVYTLFRGQVPFTQLLAVFLVSCIAGAATHVPAGLGVIEAVFLLMLGGQLERHDILAPLLAYRGIYYLAPLLVAAATYLVLELRARRLRAGFIEGSAGRRDATTSGASRAPTTQGRDGRAVDGPRVRAS